MITDPYKILGLTPQASNDEVKKAYRELSRKYHPDSYVDNPLSELAEEKFKEVQDAYNQIMQQREGSSGFTGGYGSNGSTYYNTSSQSNPGDFNLIIQYLNTRRYYEALNLLANMPNRTAHWYYCSAIGNAGIGNNIEASRHAEQALAMEPNNPDYIGLVNQLRWRNQRYQNNSYPSSSFGTGNLCCDLWCADSLCECMGGDLCSCI